MNPTTPSPSFQGAKAIDVCNRDAWLASRLLSGKHEPGDIEVASPGFRLVAERMASHPLEGKDREVFLCEWLEARGDDFADAFDDATAKVDPNGPPPADAETTPTEGESNGDGPPPEDEPDEPEIEEPAGDDEPDEPEIKSKAKGDGWPPLRIKEAPKAMPFPVDVFPPSLARFCREVAESTRTATDVPALGMLTVAGAAIGQSVQIRLKRRWTESALLYSVVIASPGRAKTPSLRPVVQPLYDVNKRLCDESAERLAEWERAGKAHNNNDSAADPGPEPPRLRAIAKDITRESLAVLLSDNPRGILCHLDEAMAWTNSWNQYKAKGTDEQFWLSNYSGDSLFVDRKGGRESIQVASPFAALLGGIQPKLVRKLKGEDGADNGFLHRITFAFPDAFPKRTWTEQEVSEKAEQDWANAIERLHSVPMCEVGGDIRPWIADLRPEAKARFVEWFDANGSAMDETDDEDREGAMAKAEGRLARLALILSRLRLACDSSRPLLENDRVPPVELEDVEGAIRLTAYFVSHAERVANAITEGAGTTDALALLKWIKRHRKGEFREAEVGETVRRFRRDPDALADAIRTLKEAGAIRLKPEQAISGKRGPKSSPLHEVHPNL